MLPTFPNILGVKTFGKKNKKPTYLPYFENPCYRKQTYYFVWPKQSNIYHWGTHKQYNIYCWGTHKQSTHTNIFSKK